MAMNYQEVYSISPQIDSRRLKNKAADLLTLEYFEAGDSEIPYSLYRQHFLALNVGQPLYVQQQCGEDCVEFVYRSGEMVFMPCGVKNSWKFSGTGNLIVITFEPDKLADFAQTELGVFLAESQIENQVHFFDSDISNLILLLMEALQSSFGSEVLFESYARVFLTKLIYKYGLIYNDEYFFTEGFTANHFKTILNYISCNIARHITIDDLSRQVAMGKDHFGKLFKQVTGLSPYQFVMSYRVEHAKELLAKNKCQLSDVAQRCGFSDHAHFSRIFKKHTGISPSKWRKSI